VASIEPVTLQKKNRIVWTAGLIKRLRGKRTQTEFGKLLGVPNNTVWRWEAGRATPDPEHTRRLSELAAKERFLESWTLVGTVTLRGGIEEASKELRRTLRRSLVATARALSE
jgi:transcriptional regulator with XRE-family HTH domain